MRILLISYAARRPRAPHKRHDIKKKRIVNGFIHHIVITSTNLIVTRRRLNALNRYNEYRFVRTVAILGLGEPRRPAGRRVGRSAVTADPGGGATASARRREPNVDTHDRTPGRGTPKVGVCLETFHTSVLAQTGTTSYEARWVGPRLPDRKTALSLKPT